MLAKLLAGLLLLGSTAAVEYCSAASGECSALLLPANYDADLYLAKPNNEPRTSD